MKMTWLLEPDMFTPYSAALIAEIRSQGHVVLTVPTFYTSLEWGDTDRYYDDFAPKGSCFRLSNPNSADRAVETYHPPTGGSQL